MTYLSVCSGIEAATVAWHPLGWSPLAFSEIEPFPSAVLRHHWPSVPNLGDLTKYHDWPSTLRPDLIVGGTPCQAFSAAGLRKGLADPRGNLTLVFLGLLECLRPRWLVWENVPGVLSDQTGAFGALLGGLAKLGYGFAYRILDAQHFGVPQRRRRLFLVGYLGDWRPPAAVLFEPESLRGDPPPRRQTGERPAPTLSARPSGGGGLGTDFDFDLDGGLVETISPAVTSKWAKGSGGPSGDECQNLIPCQAIAGTLDAAFARLQGCSPQDANHGHSHLLAFDCKASGQHGFHVGEISPALRSMGHKNTHQNGGGQVAVAFNLRGREGGAMPEVDPDGLACQRAASGGSSRSYVATSEAFAIQDGALRENPSSGPQGKGYQEELAYTLEAREALSKQQVTATGTAVRRLTPRECERLQGFPDDHTLIPWRGKPAHLCPDGPRYKALGNSMAVPVMAWIGQRIHSLES